MKNPWEKWAHRIGEINRITKDRKVLEPEKRTQNMKTALQIAKNGDTEDRMAKEQARTETTHKWTDPSSANCSEDNPSRKELGWDGPGKEREKAALTREKGALHRRKQSY